VAYGDARNNARVGVRELAKILGFNHAKISNWESGKKVPSTEDVASFLAAIGVTGDERDRLLDMARKAEEPNWLTAGIPGIDQELGALMEFEQTAQTIVVWSPLAITGLLQTGDYARAIMGASPTAGTRVAMRLGRRDIFTRHNPVEFRAIIRESALRERIINPEMMVEQLDYLVTEGKRTNVTVQVMPSNITGWYPGLMGPFMLLEFAKAKPMVHLEHHRASAFIFDDNDVAAYVELAERLSKLAATPDESVELIGQIKEEMAQ
jgi:transcriptional regulator with XRE-family HTH domain